MQKIILSIFGGIIICFFVYVCYWLVKTISYNLFYEDMVKKTVQEMVKPEYLKSK